MTEEDSRWRSWWSGDKRPFLVLNEGQFADAELRAEIETNYPGVEIRQNLPLPTL